MPSKRQWGNGDIISYILVMNSRIEVTVMRRVRVLSFVRMLVSPAALRLYLLVVFSAALTSMVSISNIANNVPNIFEYERFLTYVVVAFSHTELAVQIIVVASALIGTMVLRDAMRPIKAFQKVQRA